MDAEVEKIIDKLREIRIEKNISIVQLSADSGVSRSHIFYIETKKTIPNLETVYRLTKAMNIKMSELFQEV